MANINREFIVGLSPALATLESIIGEIAPTTIPILLVGESGTGKEMFARRIHALSSHSARPLTKISCASMNPESLSAELGLGNRGGRSGAEPISGTVLFDEVSELEPNCQRMLLYALPDGDPRPRPGQLRARMITTTSSKLDAEMQAGRFRSELYYRINGVCLRLPPLRERKQDIPMLSEFFVMKHSAQLGRPRISLSPRTIGIFMEHTWPGNIRELENIVKNIVVLGDERLAVGEFAPAPVGVTRPLQIETQMRPLKVAARAASREAERELILKALERTRWNRKRAAQELQISYKSLLYKLKQIGEPDSGAA